MKFLIIILKFTLFFCFANFCFGKNDLTNENTNQLQLINDFYKCYLNYTQVKYKKFDSAEKVCLKQLPLFSTGLQNLWNENKFFCSKFYKGEICGFGADFDIFLDGQEMEDKLNFKHSKFHSRLVKPNIIEITFHLFPNSKLSENKPTKIQFVMINESNSWKVDDIIYLSNKSATMRGMINLEMSQLKSVQNKK
jgi:hypothetical protein